MAARSPFLLADALTPFFRAWWRVRRGMTLGVRGAAVDPDGRILLVRHTYTPGWHLPGGGVEHGETAAEAMRREMAEEAGIAPLAFALHGVYSNHALFKNDHVVVFRITAWRACPHDSAGEIAERGFFNPDALPAAATPGTRRRIAELCGRAPLSWHW